MRKIVSVLLSISFCVPFGVLAAVFSSADSGIMYKYVLDCDGIDENCDYIIVDENSSLALDGTMNGVAVSDKGGEILVDCNVNDAVKMQFSSMGKHSGNTGDDGYVFYDTDDETPVTERTVYSVSNGADFINADEKGLSISNSPTGFVINNMGNGSYDIAYYSNAFGTDGIYTAELCCNNLWTVDCEKQTEIGTKPVPKTYYKRVENIETGDTVLISTKTSSTSKAPVLSADGTNVFASTLRLNNCTKTEFYDSEKKQLTENFFVDPEGTMEWTVTKNSDGTLQFVNGEKYMSYSSKNLVVMQTTKTNSKWLWGEGQSGTNNKMRTSKDVALQVVISDSAVTLSNVAKDAASLYMYKSFPGYIPGEAVTYKNDNVNSVKLYKFVETVELEEHNPLNDDRVVLDYGLPVRINPLANDGEATLVTGLSADAQGIDFKKGYDAPQLASASVTEAYGKAEISENEIVYTPLGGVFDGVKNLVYEAKAGDKYYCATVSIAPATSILYEDDYFTYSDDWKKTSNSTGNAFQSAVAPGSGDIYGFDDVYANGGTGCALGNGHYVTVDSSSNANKPTAEFEFKGTGFELISVSSSDSGLARIMLTDSSDRTVKSNLLSTYFGNSYGRLYADDKGEKTLSPSGTPLYYETDGNRISQNPTHYENGSIVEGEGDEPAYAYGWLPVDSDFAIYQTPVIKYTNLPYDKYKIKIEVAYSETYDERKAGSYSFYVDGIRVYNPCPDDEVKKLYGMDKEADPVYIKIREQLIKAEALYDLENSALIPGVAENVKGAVFIDGVSELNGSDYKSYEMFVKTGPKNEVYLSQNQAITFSIEVTGGMPEKVCIGAGNADSSETSQLFIYNAETGKSKTVSVKGNSRLFYDVSDIFSFTPSASGFKTGTMVLLNKSDSLLSLTDLRFTGSGGEALTPMLSASPDSRRVGASVLGNSVITSGKIKTDFQNTELKENEFYSFNIKTNSAVDYITVGNYRVNDYRQSGGEKIWNFSFICCEDENGNYEISAFDKQGNLVSKTETGVKQYEKIPVNLKAPADCMVKYGTYISASASAEHIPYGYHLVWLEGDKIISNGAELQTEELKQSKILTVKLMNSEGKAYIDADGSEASKQVRIEVKKNIFTVIIAFFRRLFGQTAFVDLR